MYHVTVMPCFDKKLEAARPELLSDGILWVHTYIPFAAYLWALKTLAVAEIRTAYLRLSRCRK
eukprot:COSAG02_NODE_187_length_30377_cov_3.636271_10_plen_63_part_00